MTISGGDDEADRICRASTTWRNRSTEPPWSGWLWRARRRKAASMTARSHELGTPRICRACALVIIGFPSLSSACFIPGSAPFTQGAAIRPSPAIHRLRRGAGHCRCRSVPWRRRRCYRRLRRRNHPPPSTGASYGAAQLDCCSIRWDRGGRWQRPNGRSRQPQRRRMSQHVGDTERVRQRSDHVAAPSPWILACIVAQHPGRASA